MDRIYRAIMEFGVPITGEGFVLLCYEIREAAKYPPGMFHMKEIHVAVKAQVGKKTSESVAKSVERMVKTVYEKGDRKVLASYRKGWVLECPTPKEFISVLAISIERNYEK